MSAQEMCSCGSDYANSKCILHDKNFKVVRCNMCGIAKTITDKEFKLSHYDSEYHAPYLENKEITARNMAEVLDMVERYSTHKGKILDIGCSVGTLLESAKSRGWDVYGIEPSTMAVSHAKKITPHITKGTLDNVKYKKEFFDVIVLNHVLEHIPDIKTSLRTIFSLLKPDGILFIGVPNYTSPMAKLLGSRWYGWQLDEHIWHFNPDSLKQLLIDNGFKPIMCICNNMLHKSDGLKQLLLSIFLKTTEIFNVGDKIMLIAKKQDNFLMSK